MACFTINLVRATNKQGRLTQESIEQSSRNSRTGLRAYVYPMATEAKQFRIGNTAFVTVSVVWKNMGQTPMRHGHAWICWKAFTGIIPIEFDFPKRDFEPSGLLVAGPGQEVVSQVNIGFGNLRAAFNNSVQLCIYGAIEYDDVFRATRRRKTEFCYLLKVVTEPTLDGQCDVVFEHYRRHNGADNDCYRPPDPYLKNGLVDRRENTAEISNDIASK